MKKKKKNRVKFRHLLVYALLKLPVALWLRIVYRFKAVRYGKLPSPCFIVSNHVTDCDMCMVPQSFAGLSHMYFVAGEHAFRAGFASKLLRYFLDPIARFKGTTATSTVLEMIRRVRAGASIALFPEGAKSFSGETGVVLPATGGLARKMGVPLVTYRIEGGYLTSPRWAHGLRKGKMTGRVIAVYQPEELKAMTNEEVQAIIERDLYENAFERQKTYPEMIKYKCKATAEHIERAVFICPLCGGIGTVYGEGNFVKCKCGLNTELCEYGFFHGDLPFDTMAEWMKWQAEAVENLPEYEKERELCRDPEQKLTHIDREHNKTVAAAGDLVLTTENLYVGEYKININDMVSVDTYRHGFLLFTTRDGDYYEVRGDRDYEGYKYYLLIKRYQKKADEANIESTSKA